MREDEALEYMMNILKKSWEKDERIREWRESTYAEPSAPSQLFYIKIAFGAKI